MILSSSSSRIAACMRWMRFLQSRGFPRLAFLVVLHIQKRFGVYVSQSSTVPESVKFPHPVGIVIGDGVVIGERVVIYQNVTLGGARIGDAKAQNYPEIGEGTVIFAGSVVAGKVRVGKNCTIGANAVVISDVPDGATAVGVPARILPGAD